MECFYKTIKRELIQGAKFKTPEQARKEIFKYIELYYNTKEYILFWISFLLSNLRKLIHNIHLAECPVNIDKSRITKLVNSCIAFEEFNPSNLSFKKL